jgi:tRNA/tmRNA/rRNA uracil-C5-methylase (TrmA/RlmC/RlmD family)
MENQAPKNYNPEPFPYHHELELEIVSLTNLGLGIGKVNDWVVMVPYTLPGERAIVRIFRNHKNYSEADLLKIVAPSNDRVEPQCRYFGTCGGCQYQHILYSAQLEWKRRHVEESFLKIGGIEIKARTPIHADPIYHYRSKITPHHQKPRNREIEAIGFLSATSRNRIIDIEQCTIATDEINEQFTTERQLRREQALKGKIKKGATLLLRHSMEGVTTDYSKVVTERVGERIFQFKAGDFFQNNPHTLPLMVDHVVTEAASTGLPYLIDAYCGSGLFSISAASRFEQCVGIEISESSIQRARANAHLNELKNCSYLVGDAKEIFQEVPFAAAQSVLVIDPPRKGCDREFLEQVSRFLPRSIVYVSCDPATQARDINDLLSYGYEIETAQPVDLFPQTRHIENVVTLHLR